MIRNPRTIAFAFHHYTQYPQRVAAHNAFARVLQPSLCRVTPRPLLHEAPPFSRVADLLPPFRIASPGARYRADIQSFPPHTSPLPQAPRPSRCSSKHLPRSHTPLFANHTACFLSCLVDFSSPNALDKQRRQDRSIWYVPQDAELLASELPLQSPARWLRADRVSSVTRQETTPADQPYAV